jgi:hypothetical protein
MAQAVTRVVICGYSRGGFVVHLPREPLTFPLSRGLCGAEGELRDISAGGGEYRVCQRCTRIAGELVPLPTRAERAAARAELSFSHERALGELLGGPLGGWRLWQLAMQGARDALEAVPAEWQFRSDPDGAFRALLGAVDVALETAEAAVSLQLFLDATADREGPERRRDLAELMLSRVRAARAAGT